MSTTTSSEELSAQITRVLDEAQDKCGERWCRVALATRGEDGPALRYLLLKEFTPQGFVFYTNYESRKARELASGRAALAFHWWETGCQLRVEGAVVRVDSATSDAYFESRDRESQLGAWASRQSRETDSPLSERVADASSKYPERVPRPAHWGGYRLVHDYVELWFDRPARLHERWAFRSSGPDWAKTRLDP